MPKTKSMRTLTAAEREDVLRRALAAYFDPTHKDVWRGWPDTARDAKGRSMCAVVRRGGHYYAVLCDQMAETKACYRVRHDLKLKWVKREPRWWDSAAAGLAAKLDG